MKIRNIAASLILLLMIYAIAACSNTDGDLDNKWQLRQCRYADGTNIRQDSVFYNFQKGSYSMICILKNGGYKTFFGNYSLKGDKISIILLPESVDEDFYNLYVGWENGERTFTIEELTSSSLCLVHEDVSFLFRRY